MTQPILILGTRWLAEEMFDLISEMPGYEVAGFVENQERSRCESKLENLPVFWVDDIRKFAETHLAICGISTTKRDEYAAQVAALGMRFATLIHPMARVSSRATLGAGCFIGPFCVVSTRAQLGEHVFMNRGSFIGHHRKIGNYVTLQTGANVAGLGSIGDKTYVGMKAAVLDRVDVGAGCVIGAGAVVTKSLPDRVKAMGVPARITQTAIDSK
jgi:acetyltransferase EpsM